MHGRPIDGVVNSMKYFFPRSTRMIRSFYAATKRPDYCPPPTMATLSASHEGLNNKCSKSFSHRVSKHDNQFERYKAPGDLYDNHVSGRTSSHDDSVRELDSVQKPDCVFSDSLALGWHSSRLPVSVSLRSRRTV